MSSTSSYHKTLRGPLKLKGGISLKPKKKRPRVERKPENEDSTKVVEDVQINLTKTAGSGRILTSGVSVMGQMGTKFMQELNVGDALIIVHPTTFKEETRIVRMVLSDISIAISSPFSSDLVSSTPFHYIKAPPDDAEEELKSKKGGTEFDEEEKAAYGTYAGGTTAGSEFTYRVKKASAYGGYKIMRQKLNEGLTREELLDMRSKKKGDRHCM